MVFLIKSDADLKLAAPSCIPGQEFYKTLHIPTDSLLYYLRSCAKCESLLPNSRSNRIIAESIRSTLPKRAPYASANNVISEIEYEQRYDRAEP